MMIIMLRVTMGARIVRLMLDTNVLVNLQSALIFVEMDSLEAQSNVMTITSLKTMDAIKTAFWKTFGLVTK